MQRAVRHAEIAGLTLVGLAMALGLTVMACGPLGEDFFDPGTTPGTTCYEDTDCVPNECCGNGTAAVHKDDAPDCTNVTCQGSCPTNQVECGCGYPVCRQSRCTVAFQTAPGCG